MIRCSASGREEVAPSSRASNTVSFQGNSPEDDTPATSSSASARIEDRPLVCSERKNEKSGYGLMFFDAMDRARGYEKRLEAGAKYAKLVNAAEVNTREENAAGNKERRMRVSKGSV